MPKKVPRFSDVSQKTSKLLSQLQKLKDSVVQYQIERHDDSVYAFVASLDTTNLENPHMTFDVTCNTEPVRFMTELPSVILAAYGIFISRVQEWENGGELHELLRHDD